MFVFNLLTFKQKELEEDIEDTANDDETKVNHDKYELPEEEDNKRKKKLHIEIEERHAGAGFQDLKNAGRFWRATQIMGTRKLQQLGHTDGANWVYTLM